MENAPKSRSLLDPATKGQIELLKVEQCAFPVENPPILHPPSGMIAENDLI
jgi:hypothetical protein